MPIDAEPLVDLITHLDFVQVDDDTAMGDFHGLPAAMTVLSFEPPAFMFQIRLDRDQDECSDLSDVAPVLSDTEVSMSIENGCAYLSVYDMSRFDDGKVLNIMDELAESLLSSGRATAGACLRCRNAQSAELMYVGRRPTRLCEECVDQAAIEIKEQDAALNPVSTKAAASLPLLAVAVCLAWAVFWIGMDAILNYFDVVVIETNRFVELLLIGFLAAVGWAIGWPAGVIMRRIRFCQWAPRATAAGLAITTAFAGEILYIFLTLWRVQGIVDPGLAVQFLIPVLFDYSGFWLTGKLILAGAVGLFCGVSTSERKTATLEI